MLDPSRQTCISLVFACATRRNWPTIARHSHLATHRSTANRLRDPILVILMHRTSEFGRRNCNTLPLLSLYRSLAVYSRPEPKFYQFHWMNTYEHIKYFTCNRNILGRVRWSNSTWTNVKNCVEKLLSNGTIDFVHTPTKSWKIQ